MRARPFPLAQRKIKNERASETSPITDGIILQKIGGQWSRRKACGQRWHSDKPLSLVTYRLTNARQWLWTTSWPNSWFRQSTPRKADRHRSLVRLLNNGNCRVPVQSANHQPPTRPSKDPHLRRYWLKTTYLKNQLFIYKHLHIMHEFNLR